MRLLLSLPTTKLGFVVGILLAGVIAVSQDAILLVTGAVAAAILTPVITYILTHRKLDTISVNVDGRLNESLAANQELRVLITQLSQRIADENPHDTAAGTAAIGAQAISDSHAQEIKP